MGETPMLKGAMFKMGRIAEGFLRGWNHEFGTTCRVLDRLPDDKWDWKPHPKSLGLGAVDGLPAPFGHSGAFRVRAVGGRSDAGIGEPLTVNWNPALYDQSLTGWDPQRTGCVTRVMTPTDARLPVRRPVVRH